MRDSRTGAFGVLALLFSVALRAVALGEAPSGLEGLGALVAAAALSRGLIPASMQIMPPARADGLGATAGVPDASVAALAAVLGVMLCAAGLGVATPVAVVAALAAGGAVVVVARRALGGYTGDVLGAVQQAAEAAVLIAAAGAWA
jgi:adenosylcobinamide-GDP ribazoletransferase